MKFISAKFSWESKSRVARGQLARAPRVAKEPRGPRAKREESFVVRIYVIGGVGVRELHID